MRVLCISLLLLAAAPLAAQAPAEQVRGSGEEAAAVEPEEANVPTAEPTFPLRPDAEARWRSAAPAESRSDGAAVQRSATDFMYHVLLAAVTALVTALIWKAVF